MNTSTKTLGFIIVFLTALLNFNNAYGQIVTKKSITSKSQTREQLTELKNKLKTSIKENSDNNTISYRISHTTVESALGIERLVETPLKNLTVDQRTKLLVSKIYLNPVFTFEPLVLKEDIVSENTDYALEKNDIIFSIISSKNKLDKITVNNGVRKLSKGKGAINIFIFRKGEFLVKKWTPNKDFKFYLLENDKSLAWKLHAELVEVILKSGPINWKLEDTPYLVNPLRRLVESTDFYYKPILDLFVKYGADLNWSGGINGMTALHYASGANSHHSCYYNAHHVKKNRYKHSGCQEAYFDLIAYGANDNAKMNKPHDKLGYTTPKEFYNLTFKDPNHVNKDSNFDWNAVANAVIAGARAAVDEKQRQINETNYINNVNQEYQSQVNQRIADQKQQVAQKIDEYLNRVNNSALTNPNSQTVSTQNQEINSGANQSTSVSQSTISNSNNNNNNQNVNPSLGRNACVPNPSWMPITYYVFGGSLIDPSRIKAAPYDLNDCIRVINYRDQWTLNLRAIPNSLDEEWYPQLKKVEIVEIHDAVPAEQMQWKMEQIKTHPRQFLTYQGALNEVKQKSPGPPFWTLEEAQAAADERNRE